MSKFNGQKPYGVVYGEPGVKYYQDGAFYDHRCDPIIPVEDDGILPDDNEILDDPVPEKEDFKKIELHKMGWQKIKELVEDNGGKWTNKVNGIKFLRGL